MWRSVAAVCVGGTVGCLLRWVLGLWLNSQPTAVPMGTLAANLIGGYIVGVAVAFFALNKTLEPAWRVLVITGFCGGLTTFSSFSAEVVLLLRQDRVMWAMLTLCLNLFGSLLLTFGGIATVLRFKGGTSG
ncbi:MAG TPA: fluoride efflux transporter CrcB [Steroidobacteraceae bacterium]|jgi:CrcB protein|nr:fluoride efflux transporter CrcB [Steroidobacteraceae bacterium]